ncbi:MAG: integrase arm-type DNA-binding domain-containing protein [Burkholderiales bacterium]|jgi:integrase|nr:integrase arm-type DNA-binding domain-containing protein [Burkholderiales bacterium]
MAKLTATACQKLSDGKHSDGDGLSLVVRGDHRSWVFRYSIHGKTRDIGIGKLSLVGLAEARRLAADFRAKVRQGIDPLEEKKSARTEEKPILTAAQEGKQTLLAITRSYHERFVEPVLTTKHARQWINSVEQHVPREILSTRIDRVQAGALLESLQPLYSTIPETARRVRQRLDAVFDYAMLHGMAPTNPAGAVTRSLRQRRERGSFRSLPYSEVPVFLEALRECQATSALALEFLLLTASRSEEVRLAQWSEFSGDVWTVPAARMKAGEPHTVYLSKQALAVLNTLRNLSDVWVFPSSKGVAQSNMAMLNLLSRMGWRRKTTVHGLRATFSTWANETASARPDVIEACLAHREADMVRRAYNRATFIEERRALLVAWARYCVGK